MRWILFKLMASKCAACTDYDDYPEKSSGGHCGQCECCS